MMIVKIDIDCYDRELLVMFDEKYRCVQDYIKWFEFIKKYHFVHMPEVLAASRVHPKQVTYNSQVIRDYMVVGY